MNNIYNARIKELMRAQKKTQRDLAGVLGMTQPAVHKRLEGDSTFDIDQLIKICEYLEVDLATFLYESAGMPPPKQKAQILSPDDLLVILNRRHEEVLGKLDEISRQLARQNRQN